MSTLQSALEAGLFGVTAEMAPPKGFDLTEKLEAAELLRQLRENLAEQEAMDLSAPRQDAQQDQRFHELICDSCGSPMLSQLVRRYMILSTIFNYVPVFMFLRIDKKGRQAQCRQHARIIAGLEAQDAKKASKAMASHLTDARRFFMLYATH